MIAVVLAAGRGERMGGPKALLEVDGELLVAAHARRLREVAAQVLVVVPVALVRRLTPLVEAKLLGADTASQAHTLKEALHALPPLAPADRVLVTPVDARPASLATLQQLVAVDADAVCPAYHGRSGHPLVLRRRLLSAYFAAGEPPRLDELVARVRVLVSCEDHATVEDLDTPADLPGASARRRPSAPSR